MITNDYADVSVLLVLPWVTKDKEKMLETCLKELYIKFLCVKTFSDAVALLSKKVLPQLQIVCCSLEHLSKTDAHELAFLFEHTSELRTHLNSHQFFIVLDDCDEANKYLDGIEFINMVSSHFNLPRQINFFLKFNSPV